MTPGPRLKEEKGIKPSGETRRCRLGGALPGGNPTLPGAAFGFLVVVADDDNAL